jgi:hypothetical protein
LSYTTITQAANDEALQNRTEAAVNKEVLSNPAFGNTEFGRLVRKGQADIHTAFDYPVAVANETAYEYAVNGENPDPGGDPTVITDEDILAVVQAVWPYAPGENP